ncbi:tripeptidyl-peptidase I [Talaromyces islandicus]|uniref:tripeptidyl-peptidase II n=1 Tax=Talaromyces islandicus TaxID=28573 RepID=A0A0U1LNI2_TALIS|nr:tripeptidyl-peptidase I [Talaromyces islandicus]
MVKSLFVPLALSLSVAFNLPYAVVAAPAAANYAKKEGFESIPEGWEQVSAASPSQLLNLRLSIPPADPNALEELILNIATPGHTSYGQFLSPEKLKEHAAPSSAASDAVISWLTEHSLASDAIQNDGTTLTFQLPVEQAEKMLQTQFHNYKSTATGEVRTLTLAYSVPKSIVDFVETIQPTTDFTELPSNPTIQTLTHELNASAINSIETTGGCGKYITPDCLQSLYGLPTANAKTPQGGIAVPGFLNEYASHSDLNLFLQETRPELSPRPSFTVEYLDGGKNDEGNAGIEASLDIQYTAGLANGIQTNFISVGQPSASGFIDTINKLLNQQIVPSVVSLSYGFDEAALSPNVAKNICNLFGQLGARGVSILVASGDGGVSGSRPDSGCKSFVPTFPASCPYVTSVGATRGTPTEVGAELSAGGFSNLFQRPAYQLVAVTEYLRRLGSEYSGRYNVNGRAYPDVSAQGEHLYIVVNGKGLLVDGTSASAPIFASTIALLNAQRSPLPPLGFLNPLLYLQTNVFNDISSGSNPGCSTNGFPAKPGWDPVTGLGTPNYREMLTLL